jgi:protoporphyrin/coproporphyrin ferrochelatase
MTKPYDALLIVSFGGPERPEEVGPFLENVARGRNIPPERLDDVAAHYELFGGRSPLPGEIRALLAAVVARLNAVGPELNVYWGNRFWHPLLEDALAEMAEDGVARALAFCTSAYGSPPGCREYREEIAAAAAAGPAAPVIDKLRLFYNHPGFIEPQAERAADAFAQLPDDRRDAARLVFTAHSLPVEMARAAPYERQLREACRLVAERLGRPEWNLAYQSRSGPPSQPWLEPDVRQHLFDLGRSGRARDVIVVPVGFVCEHMEVAYDLDVECRAICEEVGLNYLRAGTVGSHPRLVEMIRELILERVEPGAPRLALGDQGPADDLCPADCCRPSA